MTEAEFFKSMDFLKLGRAISSENWQVAAMTIQRMTRNAKELELTSMERPLTGLRQCINTRQKTEALNALSVLTAKRVARLKMLAEEQSQ